MKLRIRHKVLLGVFLANVLLALSLFLLNSWSFRNGFVDYINQVEETRLTNLTEQLADVYATEGNWNWARDERKRWRSLVAQNIGPRQRPKDDHHDDDHDEKRPRMPPPDLDRPEAPLSFSPFLLLADADKALVVGRARSLDDVQWRVINNRLGDTIGYLGYRRHNNLNDKLDLMFSLQQQRNFGGATLGMVLISSLIGLPLAARMVKPIQKLDHAASRLAAGDYDTRLESSSSDEIGDLTRNFNRLAETLKKNLRARQQWIADISHELRTPVAILQGEIEALQDGIRPVSSDTLASLHGEIARLARLIQDLHELTLSDMGALSYHMDRVELADVIDNTLSLNSTRLTQKGLGYALEASDDINVEGDSQRLAQLFANLMQNTLRYTDNGGKLRIRLSREQNDAVIQWEDSSPGVSPEHIPHLFDRLYRVERSRNSDAGGSGLGLAICDKIVEAHRGQINAYASELGGLRIEIRLPLAT